MKKLSIFILISITTSFCLGQDNTNNAKQEVIKSNTLSISPLWGAFGFIHANYGKVMDDGKNEYQLMFGFMPEGDFDDDNWDGKDGYTYGFKGAKGMKATYRIYRAGEAKGIFYQAQIRFVNFNWGYKSANDGWKDVSSNSFEPGVVVGYKLKLFKNIYAETFIGGTYSYSKPEDGDVTLTDEDGEKQGGGSFMPDFNLYLGFGF